MPAFADEDSSASVPEFMTWAELEMLPDEIAGEIELWDGRVVWNRRAPLVHQRFMRRVSNALESAARSAMQNQAADVDEPSCWEVETEVKVFFTPDKSSFLTPDFLIRRCKSPLADTTAADVVLVGEVLSGSDTPKRRDWKKDRYAEAGIPWYWEVELQSSEPWVSAVRAYELLQVSAIGLPVKPLRPAVYVLAGEWEPGDAGIEFPAPFQMRITWEDLAF